MSTNFDQKTLIFIVLRSCNSHLYLSRMRKCSNLEAWADFEEQCNFLHTFFISWHLVMLWSRNFYNETYKANEAR